jgi:2-polyprenyl-3-methyl-5-hydroxy-6-metoxy-1,4-benzoquinol methylase
MMTIPKKESHPKSPLSEQTELKRVGVARDHLVTGEDFTIWQCEDTGIRVTWPWPGKEEMDRYYQSQEYISHSNTSKGLINRLYKTARVFTLRSKKSLIHKNTPGKGRLLDVGCGTGEFLYSMKKSGWEVTGIEPDEATRKSANREYGLEVHPVEDFFDFPDDHFDVITLWHVLEHVDDLQRYMEKLRGMLRPGGLLVIALPNYTSYDAGYYGLDWAGYDVPRHHYHFCPDSVRKLFETHRFNFESMKRMHLDAAYVSMLSEKNRGGNGNLLRGMAVGGLSWLNSIRKPATCSSLAYLARPS